MTVSLSKSTFPLVSSSLLPYIPRRNYLPPTTHISTPRISYPLPSLHNRQTSLPLPSRHSSRYTSGIR